jgi:hypothetical protein
VDTLDANFVIPSFEVLSASHLYTWSMAGQGIFTFSFANINLPDSNANEPATVSLNTAQGQRIIYSAEKN